MSLIDTAPKASADPTPGGLVAAQPVLRPRKRQFLSRLLRSKAATISVLILLIVVVAAVAAP